MSRKLNETIAKAPLLCSARYRPREKATAAGRPPLSYIEPDFVRGIDGREPLCKHRNLSVFVKVLLISVKLCFQEIQHFPLTSCTHQHEKTCRSFLELAGSYSNRFQMGKSYCVSMISLQLFDSGIIKLYNRHKPLYGLWIIVREE